MQTFKIQIQKKFVYSFQCIVGEGKLNIKIISEEPLPGIFPSGDLDTELTIQLLSEDLSELVTLGFLAAKVPLPFTLGQSW